jgi:hypothetical protein
MTFRVFKVGFPDKQLRVTVYEMPDGKLEQYLVMAPGSYGDASRQAVRVVVP